LARELKFAIDVLDKDISTRTLMLASRLDANDKAQDMLYQVLPMLALAVQGLGERIKELDSKSPQVQKLQRDMDDKVMPVINEIDKIIKKQAEEKRKQKEKEQEQLKQNEENKKRKDFQHFA
jgi:molecular chaperone DnaK (HSP70)